MVLRLRVPTLVPLLAFLAGAMAAVAQASPPASSANGPGPSSARGPALATVEASPRAILHHDKAGWLGLFARNARLQDPVGSPWLQRGLGGKDPLAQFYDVFIAPSSIHFDAYRDYVDGRDVLRDVTIRTELAPHCVVEVPAFVHYELEDDGSTQRLASLAAHWELATNFDQVRSQWWACARSSLALSSRMVQHLGLGYSVGYTGALRTVGAAGKTQTLSLLSSVTARDREAFLEHFADDAQVQCPLRGSRFMESPSSFWSTLQDANVGFAVLDKTIAAGRTVSLRVRLWAHGWSRESVLLVSYAPEGLRIQRLRCFL